ncbi:MAG TPA: biotin--[acetyl-CoA-carboxylase] ligase [Rhodospirillaceae bacterium]|nr:biotin--[acetyl-CoA-carboxylase] ligase [Rhodospirillaceae bacterium]
MMAATISADIPAITVLETTGSTNDDAKERARAGAAEGTVVHALRQTAGRGRQGNHWMSEAGNLYMSMILRPNVSAADSGQLSFLAAVALAQTVQVLLPPGSDVALKWPNDVLIGGRKAAGILLEAESAAQSAGPEWLVLGMGLNLMHAPEGAVSLQSAGAGDIDVVRARDLLTGNVLALYRRWRALTVLAAPAIGALVGIALPMALGMPISFFSVAALFVVMGAGIDHSVFLFEAAETDGQSKELVVFLAALTTILSMGLLGLSGTYPVASFGVVVAAGVTAAYVTSFVPARVRRRSVRADNQD